MKNDNIKELYVSADDDLQAVLDGIREPTVVRLRPGIYRCKLWIRSDDVHLIGENAADTVIVWDDYAKKEHADGREYNTFRTYTVCVTGERVTLENLTVENANTSPENVGQCVALSVNSRIFRGQSLILKSMQDTLFTAPFPDDLVIRYAGLTDDATYYDGFVPREQLYMEGNAVHLFKDCDIYGTVDFIFGGAEAYFIRCRLISLAEKRGHGYVAAPSHGLAQEFGYVFKNCSFVNGGAAEGSVYLARPWRDFGKCDFIDCTCQSHISPALFDRWNDTYRDRTARFAYAGLRCDFTPDPVPWCRKLTDEKIEQIEQRLEKFTK